MDALKFADLLKPFPLLQLFIGATVFLAIMAVTLRGLKENKKDAHIAGPTHDPLGLTVLANGLLTQLSMIHSETVKTNARLAELKDSHEREMDHLRETVRELDSR